MIRYALLLAATGLQTPTEPALWRALSLPSICLEDYAPPRLPALEYGRHLVDPGDDLAQRPFATPPGLPVATLLGLLQDEVARRGAEVEFQPTAPPVLARGSAQDLDALEAMIADLDRVGRALDIEVSAWLTEGAAFQTTHPDAASLRAAVGDRAPWGTSRVRSGAEVAFGTRASRSFVREYSIDLAAESGVAEPELGAAILGTTLHLVATRTSGGRRVHVEGFLDLAELLSLESFDTDTYDLGVVQQPRVGSLQLAFSGTVESGGALAVSFAGAPLSIPDRTLWLSLECETDPVVSDSTNPSLRGLDLALLDRAVVDLPMPHPGAGLEGLELPDNARTLSEALPASALAQAFARGSGRSAAGRPVWAPGLLLARADGAGWAEVDALASAAHRSRERGAQLELVHAGLRVLLPVAEGRPARVLAGIETTRVTEYDAEVATDIWLPQAVVEPAYDGLLVQGTLRAGAFRATAWVASSREGQLLETEESGLGRMQLSDREVQAATCVLRSDQAGTTILAAPALTSASLTNVAVPR